jgi:tripeptide aminopeptidase
LPKKTGCTDRVPYVTGECRSHSPDFLEDIVAVYQNTFEEAAQTLQNDAKQCGRVEFTAVNDYRAFRLDPSEPCVLIAQKAVETVGLKPNPLIMDAGLDANNFNEKGLPTVTLGSGTHHFHQTDEYIEIEEYLTACQVLLTIATHGQHIS